MAAASPCCITQVFLSLPGVAPPCPPHRGTAFPSPTFPLIPTDPPRSRVLLLGPPQCLGGSYRCLLCGRYPLLTDFPMSRLRVWHLNSGSRDGNVLARPRRARTSLAASRQRRDSPSNPAMAFDPISCLYSLLADEPPLRPAVRRTRGVALSGPRPSAQQIGNSTIMQRRRCSRNSTSFNAQERIT
jgi:hypothetical protein